jgi:hypothetical protein
VKRFGSMADVSMEREGEAAGGRVVATHLVCLCYGGGWRKPIGLWRIFLGRIIGRNSLLLTKELLADRQTDGRQFNHFCYRKFILSYEGGNSAILRLQMRLMCWDVDFVHRPDTELVDADYWSRLGVDLDFDPLLRGYLAYALARHHSSLPPTDLPMRPENMPYYRGPNPSPLWFLPHRRPR